MLFVSDVSASAPILKSVGAGRCFFAALFIRDRGLFAWRSDTEQFFGFEISLSGFRACLVGSITTIENLCPFFLFEVQYLSPKLQVELSPTNVSPSAVDIIIFLDVI